MREHVASMLLKHAGVSVLLRGSGWALLVGALLGIAGGCLRQLSSDKWQVLGGHTNICLPDGRAAAWQSSC